MKELEEARRQKIEEEAKEMERVEAFEVKTGDYCITVVSSFALLGPPK